MKIAKIIAGLATIDFAALHLYALYTDGLAGILSFPTNTWLYVAVADLLIALGIVSAIIWADAKRTGRNPIGYILITLCTGSFGPLLYFLMRDSEKSVLKVPSGTPQRA